MVELLLTYKYLIVVPLAIIEGPIVSVICGFLTTLGVFNPLLVFAVMVAGDIIGDAIYYFIGYSGKGLLRYFKISEEKIEKAKILYENNHKKAIAGSKIMWGIGTAGLMAAGALHVPYKRYFKTCALYSLGQSFIMILLGIFFGGSYMLIGKYMDYYTAGTSIVGIFIILFILFQYYRKKKNQKISL
ncbi:hypothetical protein A2738_02240 [Candidatus Nomurabacteria bacterium RIFCSPHIGHO2_01_FULL_42_15]|uniref:DedA family protein n=1 Tax=Candidatus Nomurabacteria bacterium RIFCSPHIGHO2_01_FULL_42_15 TaxID=1801742 RepID=A0A1F6VFA9_9BACT|nr:MAG: hypothetical protein A2738_02240 [Candidatus Nomurabacteria bacterium RIFCSPHIGHO2_01_FULL_42_15]OGI93420.1 MAG: hypothetical protein A3A99_01970 [Candidatus Nomurabacteria bacterium RIFCSPLOWO2_01_FULL_41_18]